jgi:hypothetical protein
MNTSALSRFETVTLGEFNRRLVEEQGQTNLHFSTYEELKDIHDNEGTTRRYLTGIAEHVIMDYIDTLSSDEMNALEDAFNIQDVSDDKLYREIRIRCALWEKYVTSPSHKQMKMM